MSFITTLTRMYLTRTTKPFTFTSQYDKRLDYKNTENLGLYVHIPFCRSICDFCPYCKTVYNPEACDRYVDSLIREIHLVGKSCHEKKTVTSLYFGGGSPALAIDRIGEIISTLHKYFDITDGIGIELHPSDVTVDVLTRLSAVGVTKISIGIQSFCDKYASILGRKTPDVKKISEVLKTVKMDTVSMDLIFALPGQSAKELKADIDTALSCGANHIAIYPFIDFTFTKSSVSAMKKREKRKLLDEITGYFFEKGCVRDSIWTFSRDGNAKYSSMTRDNFLGFGCSATTLLYDSFKINTFSVEQYEKRINEGELPTSLTIKFTPRQRMVYYLFWTAYSTKVRKKDFERFFGVSLSKMYGFELFVARLLGFVRKKGDVYEMTLKGAFYYHYYENFYTLSYIDKMWGIMRKEAFPQRIEL